MNDETEHHDDHPKPRVKIETDQGEIVLELWPEAAPHTVDNFLQLVHEGFYDGLSFHRVIPQYVVQAGCPIGDGTGGAGYTINAEFNDKPHERGTLSMARRVPDPNSASSQFFICLTRQWCADLDGQYTVFGKVLEGMDTVDRIAETPLLDPHKGTPIHPPMIHHAYDWYDDHDPYHGHHPHEYYDYEADHAHIDSTAEPIDPPEAEDEKKPDDTPPH